MIKVNFRLPDGEMKTVSACEENTLMQAAVSNGIDGIIGDCGGNLSCATCHAYIEAEFRQRLPAPSEMEIAMLDCALHVTDDSRLTCQVMLSPQLDGLIVTVPPLD
ncbi:2Fe-2S iron-sulfur cluster-binding protein [Rhizorhabdus dicambivorans]|uniref:(2Fe-2S)-binding protein n=1 Tax=Rhizorhabdus dicambivorans TaxID=1850238 RepID=A0A2A4FRX2_9SPHN|nr:2Fe-2S iron-sulfur cluster-binding protein [Rhizorhabdus dicambivorans]ATE66316.1 (2Fe-2S)-binding protein [Rhizorhabdus dicambivorans]PCE40151.1 (2Fe-2S)-binding protein [Rhizorhabdus dicambivorans]